MGQILDKWLSKNSERLSALTGQPARPGMAPGMPPGAFPPDVASSQPAQAFPSAAGPGGAGSFDAADAAPPQAAFAAQAPVAAPVAVQAPAAKAPQKAAPKPQKNGDDSFEKMYADADPKKIDEAIKVMEQTSGKSVEELYQQQTGRPPPKGESKRKVGEFLFEFGLSLMSAPAGTSDVEAVGGAAQATIGARREREAVAEEKRIRQEAAAEESRIRQDDRRIAAEERKLGRVDKAFDREVKLEQLELQRKKVQADLDRPIAGRFDNYIGDDGFMYTYNEATGEGRRVMVNGRPVKPDPKQNTTRQQRFDTEVRYNMYMDVHGKDAEGEPLEGADLRTTQEGALKFANRQKEYTKDEARRDAVKMATNVLSKVPDFVMAMPDEQKVMLEEKVDEYTELLMYGGGPGQGEPDASRLSEGTATPVTNESGVMEYWTLRDGQPVKVSENELQQ